MYNRQLIVRLNNGQDRKYFVGGKILSYKNEHLNSKQRIIKKGDMLRLYFRHNVVYFADRLDIPKTTEKVDRIDIANRFPLILDWQSQGIVKKALLKITSEDLEYLLKIINPGTFGVRRYFDTKYGGISKGSNKKKNWNYFKKRIRESYVDVIEESDDYILIELEIVNDPSLIKTWLGKVQTKKIRNEIGSCLLSENLRQVTKFASSNLTLAVIYNIHLTHQMLNELNKSYDEYTLNTWERKLDGTYVETKFQSTLGNSLQKIRDERRIIIELLTLMINGDIGNDKFLDKNNKINQYRLNTFKYILPKHEVYSEKQ